MSISDFVLMVEGSLKKRAALNVVRNNFDPITLTLESSEIQKLLGLPNPINIGMGSGLGVEFRKVGLQAEWSSTHMTLTLHYLHEPPQNTFASFSELYSSVG